MCILVLLRISVAPLGAPCYDSQNGEDGDISTTTYIIKFLRIEPGIVSVVPLSCCAEHLHYLYHWKDGILHYILGQTTSIFKVILYDKSWCKDTCIWLLFYACCLAVYRLAEGLMLLLLKV